MKAYKIFNRNMFGSDTEEEYACNINKAYQIFNNKVRNTIDALAGNIIDKDDFSEQVSGFKDSFYLKQGNIEIISRKYPYILYKNKDKEIYVSNIYGWYGTSYEYEEYDIETLSVVMKEIDVQE